MSVLVNFEIPILDSIAKDHIENGEPVIHKYNGWPHSRVVSTSPFEEKRYGVFRNRAPHLVGPVAIAGFTTISELWPGVVIDPVIQDEETEGGLYVAGFSPYEYRIIVNAMLTHRS
jgi:hypothetical protein